MVDEDPAPNDVRSLESCRVIVDAAGRRWLVYEAAISYDRRIASLVFETQDVVRRLRQYPPTWASLSVAELLELCETGK